MLLDQSTINKIAAGEVIERPAAVVKELVENAMDAGASFITVEVKEGGTTLIRITDNGCGIPKEDIPLAFKRHATSKIRNVEDLLHVASLGFRGEALASIASIAQVELITKTGDELVGVRYLIEGGEEKTMEEIGCPEGSTFLIRNLFYNTPARRKFLKSPMTESSYINEVVEKLAISHPQISFKFISNNQTKLYTSGNGSVRDIIYQIYGKDITKELLTVNREEGIVSIEGFIGKPVVSRGNRSYMTYFINGRYVKSSVINKAIEEAYRPFSMAHRYPFTALNFMVASEWIDVNVHPTKMEIRFHDSQVLYGLIYEALHDVLVGKEFIPEIDFEEKGKEKRKEAQAIPEPFEKERLQAIKTITPEISVKSDVVARPELPVRPEFPAKPATPVKEDFGGIEHFIIKEEPVYSEQINLFEKKLLEPESVPQHRIIGQLFSTYWIVEFEDKMFLIDQHAAHEKVLFEKNMKLIQEKEAHTQMLNPPLVVTLGMKEEQVLLQNQEHFRNIGFEFEPFGGKEYAIYGVPADFLGLAEKEVFMDLIDKLGEESKDTTLETVLEKAASMSCKAAVKGNNKLSFAEAETLIGSLLKLENPYHCPHGRPTIISMSKQEIEKKFKRII